MKAEPISDSEEASRVACSLVVNSKGGINKLEQPFAIQHVLALAIKGAKVHLFFVNAFPAYGAQAEFAVPLLHAAAKEMGDEGIAIADRLVSDTVYGDMLSDVVSVFTIFSSRLLIIF